MVQKATRSWCTADTLIPPSVWNKKTHKHEPEGKRSCKRWHWFYFLSNHFILVLNKQPPPPHYHHHQFHVTALTFFTIEPENTHSLQITWFQVWRLRMQHKKYISMIYIHCHEHIDFRILLYSHSYCIVFAYLVGCGIPPANTIYCNTSNATIPWRTERRCCSAPHRGATGPNNDKKTRLGLDTWSQSNRMQQHLSFTFMDVPGRMIKNKHLRLFVVVWGQFIRDR